jgi:hypothetical protein
VNFKNGEDEVHAEILPNSEGLIFDLANERL